MFTKNQKLLRSQICGNNEHNKIALEIPKDTVIDFYKRLCSEKQSVICVHLIEMTQGKREPHIDQLSAWSKACKWHNGLWENN